MSYIYDLFGIYSLALLRRAVLSFSAPFFDRKSRGVYCLRVTYLDGIFCELILANPLIPQPEDRGRGY